MTQKLTLQWLPCQAPGIIGSVLGLVGLVLVYCDWVRWKFWSATSISVWQHVKLSEQICPWDTLVCCWDIKQPTNNNNPVLNVTSFCLHKQNIQSESRAVGLCLDFVCENLPFWTIIFLQCYYSKKKQTKKQTKTVSGLFCLHFTMSKVFDQNGVSLRYIMLEIHHSGRELSSCDVYWEC